MRESDTLLVGHNCYRAPSRPKIRAMRCLFAVPKQSSCSSPSWGGPQLEVYCPKLGIQTPVKQARNILCSRMNWWRGGLARNILSSRMNWFSRTLRISLSRWHPAGTIDSTAADQEWQLFPEVLGLEHRSASCFTLSSSSSSLIANLFSSFRMKYINFMRVPGFAN